MKTSWNNEKHEAKTENLIKFINILLWNEVGPSDTVVVTRYPQGPAHSTNIMIIYTL